MGSQPRKRPDTPESPALNKGSFDKALSDFTEAIRLDPNDALAYDDRGFAYANKGY